MQLPDLTQYTPADVRQLKAALSQHEASLEAQRQLEEAARKAEQLADLDPLQAALEKVAKLLAAADTPGSIRSVMGTAADAPGTSSLRAIKSLDNNQAAAGSVVKALAGLVLDLAQLQVAAAQSSRLALKDALRGAESQADQAGAVAAAQAAAGDIPGLGRIPGLG